MQHTVPLPTAANRLHRLRCRPAIFFRHLRLITLRLPQEVSGTHLKKCYDLNIFFKARNFGIA
jgi:hypothetical protein